ncbi:MAG: hypothetical protein HYX32_13495 [Actinobacteria bacterium]|nr:hypothetical protein [Actinomycetota bacterium]
MLGELERTMARRNNAGVLGPIIIIVVLVIAIPVGVLMSSAVIAWVLGWFLRDDADKRNAGTEYVELGR